MVDSMELVDGVVPPSSTDDAADTAFTSDIEHNLAQLEDLSRTLH